jgi:hypothetical protein
MIQKMISNEENHTRKDRKKCVQNYPLVKTFLHMRNFAYVFIIFLSYA